MKRLVDDGKNGEGKGSVKVFSEREGISERKERNQQSEKG